MVVQYVRAFVRGARMPVEQLQETDPPAVALMKSRLAGFETEAGRMHGVTFVPRATDVFVSTSPKCGTTWMYVTRIRRWCMRWVLSIECVTVYYSHRCVLTHALRESLTEK